MSRVNQAARVFLTTLALLGLALAAGSCGSSSNGPSCGTGTKLDEATNTCVPDGTVVPPDFGRVVGDTTIGDFKLTEVNVPDVLQPGFPQQLTFKIQNMTTSASDLTFIRLSVTRASKADVDTYLANIAGKGQSCTNECPQPKGRCDDGGDGSATSLCALGSDCDDCGLRGGLTACVPEKDQDNVPIVSQSTCRTGFYCHPVANACHLDLQSIAGVMVDTIPAGETKLIHYEARLPPGWSTAGTYQLVFSVKEERLTKDATGDIVHDDSQPALYPGQVEIERAGGAFNAGDLPITIPGEPVVEILSATLANNSFELPTNQIDSPPAMTLSLRFMAKGRPILAGAIDEVIRARLELTVGGQQVGLDAVDDRGALVDAAPIGLAPPGGVTLIRTQCTQDNFGTCDKLLLPESMERDSTVKIFLKRETIKGLSTWKTLKGSSQIAGTLRVTVLPTGQSQDLPVVFLPPEPSRPAAPSDSTEPAATTPGGTNMAKDYPDKMYPEKDNVTPMLADKFGTDWAGASYQLKNVTSKERLYQAVIKQAFLADNYARLHVLEIPIDIITAAADIDFGTQRALATNTATGQVRVPALRQSFFDFLENGVQLYDTVLAFDYAFADDCAPDENDPNVEKCLIIGGEEGEEEFGQVGVDLDLPEADKSVELEAKKEKIVCKGPLCLIGSVEGSLKLGIKGTLGFFRDTGASPEVFTGIEATFGPYAEATGVATGEVNVTIAGVTITGTVNFLKADFTPTARLGLMQSLDSANNCWMKNQGRISFEGPASLEMLSGEIKLEAWVGVKIKIWFITINLRQKVFEFTLVKWDPVYSKRWTLWSLVKDFSYGPGLCPNAPNPQVEWKSPIGCKTFTGADGYCGDSLKGVTNLQGYTGKYWGRFYTTGSQCGSIVVDGSTELHLGNWGDMSGDAIRFAVSPAVGPGFGPLQDAVTPDPAECRLKKQNNGLVSYEGGTVGCGQWWDAKPSWSQSQKLFVSKQNPYSGEFKGTRFNFCNNTMYDGYRWIDFYLSTDSTLTRSGVTLRLEPQEGEESEIYSGSSFWMWKRTNDKLDNPPLATQWRQLAFDSKDIQFQRPGLRGNGSGGITSLGPLTAEAPFTAEDGQKAEWMWWANGSDGDNVASTVYFRRPFLAAGSRYTLHVGCDDQCHIYLDATNVGYVEHYTQHGKFEINTNKGGMHVLSIMATNTAGGAGVNVMMKVKQ